MVREDVLNSNLHGSATLVDASSIMSGNVTYCVHAGMCTVRMVVDFLSDISTATAVASGLPLPAIEPRFIIAQNGGSGTGQFYVNTQGELLFNSAKENYIFYFTFTYPIL